jgi:hypothetical protein
MHDEFGTLHRFGEGRPVEQVSLVQGELRMIHCAGKESPLSGRKIVKPGNAMTGGEKAVGHAATDESGRTCHKNAQVTSFRDSGLKAPSILDAGPGAKRRSSTGTFAALALGAFTETF